MPDSKRFTDRDKLIAKCRGELASFATANGYDWAHLFGGNYCGWLLNRTSLDVVQRRHIYARGRELGYSYPVIGAACKRSHSTVITALRATD